MDQKRAGSDWHFPAGLPIGGEFPFEEVVTCPVCKGTRRELLFWGQDDRYGYQGFFPIVICNDCGLAYLGLRPHVSVLPELYRKYYTTQGKKSDAAGKGFWKKNLKNSPLGQLYQWLTNPRENLYRWVLIRPGLRLLDVGSGLVLPEVNRLRKLGAQWVGVEIDPEVCRLLASDGVQTYAGTLEDFARTNPEPFDYLVLSQVLEHIYHPQSFLSTARSLLRAGGKIVLSCPNFDSFLRKRYGELWLGWHVPYHVTHYNRQTLDRLAQATGFRISRLLTVTPSNWFQAQRQMAKGLKFRPDFLAKNRSLQRLLDIYLATRHLSLLGDAILAELEIIS